jgi:hypothetical protein
VSQNWTDIEVLKEMFHRAGIGILHPPDPYVELSPNEFAIQEGRCANVEGYGWFFTIFTFDAEGKLSKIGIWE